MAEHVSWSAVLAHHQARIVRCIRSVLPGTTKTCIWLVKITVVISLAIVFLKYFGILPWFSRLVSPFFNLIGLPGEAALPYVTGYLVNVYAAISVAATMQFDVRVLTILGVMILCSHNMITETAVQKKTGSPAVRMVVIRTLSAFGLAFVINRIMPGEAVSAQRIIADTQPEFMALLEEWAVSTVHVVLKMTVLIYSLAILQKLLQEYGVIRWLSKVFGYLLIPFGLPARTSFLWIVANTLGLAYGAAVMIEEAESGNLTRKEIDLLNSHIAISHSNLEDLLLLSAMGCIWYVLLLSRLAGALLLVWELRFEYYLKENFIKK